MILRQNQDAEESSKDEVATSENVLKESFNFGRSSIKDNLHLRYRKEKISLETTALQTEYEKTEEPRKPEQKLSSVSTTTSQDKFIFNKTNCVLWKPITSF